MKYSRKTKKKVAVLIAAIFVLLCSMILPIRDTHYSDSLKGAMTGISITFLGAWLLAVVHKNNYRNKGRLR